MSKQIRKCASTPKYSSPNQLSLPGFETPFDQHLVETNRWVVLSKLIPWDAICNQYLNHICVGQTGRPPISPRIIIGSLIIKHMCNLDDRETVAQMSENIYMQYFLGYSSFSKEPPFDSSLFVEIRKRLDMDTINSLNEKIVELKTYFEKDTIIEKKTENTSSRSTEDEDQEKKDENQNTNKGRVIYDATACPQDIAYPTDLTLLSDSREKSEYLIDILYNKSIHKIKPRTYREKARRLYLKTAQNRNKSRKVIRKAIGQQLHFLYRNINHIEALLDTYEYIPLNKKDHKYLFVIKTLYDQQHQMHKTRQHSIEHRIVSIHQPHVRPIVRGKSQAKVEFGAKINLSLINGISFIDQLSWDAFNEGNMLVNSIEQYKRRWGFYPREVLVDKIYCTRANRAELKERNIKLIAKPLGRPSAMTEHVSPGERNPIEGKFGQAKTGYGLNRIKARLKNTSESWIASIILVLNLVKLAGSIPYCLFLKTYQYLTNWNINFIMVCQYDYNGLI